MANHLRITSPRSEVLRERWFIDEVFQKIREWPEDLQKSFNKIVNQDEINLQRIFNVLIKLKAEVVPEHSILISECINFLHDNFTFLKETYASFPKPCNPKRHDITESAIPKSDSSFSIPKKNFCNSSRVLFAVTFCVAVIAIIYQFFPNPPSPSPPRNKIAEWTQNIIHLQEKFPSQNEMLWPSIVSGVKTIVTEKPTKPSVLLLLHNDKRTSSCLASEVGKEAVKLLSNNLQEPIIIRGEDLKLNKSLMKDYSLFSETYKYDIQNKHVMIVLDLQEIPATLAQSFHVLCDVENPLVRDAAFLFTMQVDEKEKRRPTAIAEKYLSQLWKDTLDIDIMQPLITRITDAVELVKMESQLPC